MKRPWKAMPCSTLYGRWFTGSMSSFATRESAERWAGKFFDTLQADQEHWRVRMWGPDSLGDTTDIYPDGVKLSFDALTVPPSEWPHHRPGRIERTAS